ncbi:hypothetical protein PROFUN_02776 [Planoprotostelium fungivorum]|uniref:Cyclic nucleotide-binding domain-containing protein n=1 Tax=Planoprotostelium fungivorum TaxID=1890364 RepID=A0A2P6NXJ0_9EUKA|nr:hypothetical protein PROFUN_02776 [Planoprotostelium fungivorum]
MSDDPEKLIGYWEAETNLFGVKTKIRGVIDEDIMKWEEFMLIKGDPSRIAIPTQYVGKLLGRTINGRMRSPAGTQSTFTATKMKEESDDASTEDASEENSVSSDADSNSEYSSSSDDDDNDYIADDPFIQAQDEALAEAIANGEEDSNYDDVLSEAHETYDEREARELEEIYAEEAEQMLMQAEEAEQRAAQSRAQMRENFEQRQREKEAVAERKKEEELQWARQEEEMQREKLEKQKTHAIEMAAEKEKVWMASEEERIKKEEEESVAAEKRRRVEQTKERIRREVADAYRQAKEESLVPIGESTSPRPPSEAKLTNRTVSTRDIMSIVNDLPPTTPLSRRSLIRRSLSQIDIKRKRSAGPTRGDVTSRDDDQKDSTHSPSPVETDASGTRPEGEKKIGPPRSLSRRGSNISVASRRSLVRPADAESSPIQPPSEEYPGEMDSEDRLPETHENMGQLSHRSSTSQIANPEENNSDLMVVEENVDTHEREDTPKSNTSAPNPLRNSTSSLRSAASVRSTTSNKSTTSIKSAASVRSAASIRSATSVKSSTSVKSTYSIKSAVSVTSTSSMRSHTSQMSRRSQHSIKLQRSTGDMQKSEREEENDDIGEWTVPDEHHEDMDSGDLDENKDAPLSDIPHLEITEDPRDPSQDSNEEMTSKQAVRFADELEAGPTPTIDMDLMSSRSSLKSSLSQRRPGSRQSAKQNFSRNGSPNGSERRPFSQHSSRSVPRPGSVGRKSNSRPASRASASGVPSGLRRANDLYQAEEEDLDEHDSSGDEADVSREDEIRRALVASIMENADTEMQLEMKILAEQELAIQEALLEQQRLREEHENEEESVNPASVITDEDRANRLRIMKLRKPQKKKVDHEPIRTIEVRAVDKVVRREEAEIAEQERIVEEILRRKKREKKERKRLETQNQTPLRSNLKSRGDESGHKKNVTFSDRLEEEGRKKKRVQILEAPPRTASRQGERPELELIPDAELRAPQLMTKNVSQPALLSHKASSIPSHLPHIRSEKKGHKNQQRQNLSRRPRANSNSDKKFANSVYLQKLPDGPATRELAAPKVVQAKATEEQLNLISEEIELRCIRGEDDLVEDMEMRRKKRMLQDKKRMYERAAEAEAEAERLKTELASRVRARLAERAKKREEEEKVVKKVREEEEEARQKEVVMKLVMRKRENQLAKVRQAEMKKETASILENQVVHEMIAKEREDQIAKEREQYRIILAERNRKMQEERDIAKKLADQKANEAIARKNQEVERRKKEAEMQREVTNRLKEERLQMARHNRMAQIEENYLKQEDRNRVDNEADAARESLHMKIQDRADKLKQKKAEEKKLQQEVKDIKEQERKERIQRQKEDDALRRAELNERKRRREQHAEAAKRAKEEELLAMEKARIDKEQQRAEAERQLQKMIAQEIQYKWMRAREEAEEDERLRKLQIEESLAQTTDSDEETHKVAIDPEEEQLTEAARARRDRAARREWLRRETERKVKENFEAQQKKEEEERRQRIEREESIRRRLTHLDFEINRMESERIAKMIAKKRAVREQKQEKKREERVARPTSSSAFIDASYDQATEDPPEYRKAETEKTSSSTRSSTPKLYSARDSGTESSHSSRDPTYVDEDNESTRADRGKELPPLNDASMALFARSKRLEMQNGRSTSFPGVSTRQQLNRLFQRHTEQFPAENRKIPTTAPLPSLGGEIRFASIRQAQADAAFRDAITSPPGERSEADIDAMYKIIKDLNAFAEFDSEFKLREICKVLKYTECQPNSYVVHAGSPLTCWYVVYRGTVLMSLPKDESDDNNFAPDKSIYYTVKPGDSFGQNSLKNRSDSSATLWTPEAAKLIYVETADYDRLLRHNHTIISDQFFSFFKSHQLFSAVPESGLRHLCDGVHYRKYVGKITRAGVEPDEIFFVKKGECRASKQIDLGVRKLWVKKDSIFGETALLEQRDRSVSVTVTSNHAEVYALSVIEFQKYISLAELRGLRQWVMDKYPSNPELVNLYLEKQEKERWNKYKERLMTSLRQDMHMQKAKLRNNGEVPMRELSKLKLK